MGQFMMKSGFRNYVPRNTVNHTAFDEAKVTIERTAARDTVNHLQFDEVDTSVERVGECVEDENQKLQEAMKREVLEAARDTFLKNKVYGNDMKTKLLLINYLEGLEDFLDQNKSVLQEIEEIQNAGATKIQSLVRGSSARKKKVQFNDAVQEKEFRKSEVLLPESS